MLLGLAPGGVFLANLVAQVPGGLLHRRFTLTIEYRDGGLLSVALSRESPRVAVSHHRVLWSPDVPRHMPRPPGQLIHVNHTRMSEPWGS